VRKPSGGERAWFLEEESEPRNMRILIDLCRKSIGDSKGVYPLGRRASIYDSPEKGRQGVRPKVERPLEGGKRCCSPSKVSMGKIHGLTNQSA
jgi:hypothetical protein